MARIHPVEFEQLLAVLGTIRSLAILDELDAASLGGSLASESRQVPMAENMVDCYDVIVIGAGLGGLTAAAKLARAGSKALLVERNYGIGGAASTYKSGTRCRGFSSRDQRS